MASKHKFLAKNVLLFSLNNFIPKLLSIVLVPIYTSYLSTAEYGISDLIITTVSLLLPIFTLDIQDAVIRFTLDKNYNKTDVLSVALRIVLLGTGLICIGTILVSAFHFPGLENSYLLFFVLMYFTTALSNTVSFFCRGIDKVNVMVIGGILKSVVTLSANILFLVVFQWGLTGYLLANTIGSIVSLICCFVGARLHRYIKWKASKNVLRDMVVFSFPLIFNVISWWINSALDRYILTWFAGVAISGLYAAAQKIPGILSVFQSIFGQAWSISAIKEFDKNDSDGFISNMYNMMNFVMITICSGIIFMNIPISKILYSAEFFEAWRFVPPLLISIVFNSMALFIGSIFTAVKDTKTLSVSTITGAGVNTVCNFVLIYFWGAYGAAIATLIGYVVVLIIRHIILRKHIFLQIKWWRDIIAYLLLLIQMILAYGGIKYMWIQPALLVCFIILFRKEADQVIRFVKKKILKT